MSVTFGKPAGQVQFVGNNHGQISQHLKAWIMQGDVCVVGVIGEGTSRQLQTNWDSPFEGATADSTKFATAAALAQSYIGVTTVTQMSSMQIWKGAQPHTFSLVLSLYALKSAKQEVMDAIRHLELFASTNLNKGSPVDVNFDFEKFTETGNGFAEGEDATTSGQAPQKVLINIGRSAIYDDVVLESVDTPIGGPKDYDGNLVFVEVTLNLQSSTSINRQDINKTFGV
jgi:hypothetical protein